MRLRVSLVKAQTLSEVSLMKWPCWLDIPSFYSNEPQWPLKHCLVIPVSSVNHASLFTVEIDCQLKRVMHAKTRIKTPLTAAIMCSYIKTLALTKPVV